MNKTFISIFLSLLFNSTLHCQTKVTELPCDSMVITKLNKLEFPSYEINWCGHSPNTVLLIRTQKELDSFCEGNGMRINHYGKIGKVDFTTHFIIYAGIGISDSQDAKFTMYSGDNRLHLVQTTLYHPDDGLSLKMVTKLFIMDFKYLRGQISFSNCLEFRKTF